MSRLLLAAAKSRLHEGPAAGLAFLASAAARTGLDHPGEAHDHHRHHPRLDGSAGEASTRRSRRHAGRPAVRLDRGAAHLARVGLPSPRRVGPVLGQRGALPELHGAGPVRSAADGELLRHRRLRRRLRAGPRHPARRQDGRRGSSVADAHRPRHDDQHVPHRPRPGRAAVVARVDSRDLVLRCRRHLGVRAAVHRPVTAGGGRAGAGGARSPRGWPCGRCSASPSSVVCCLGTRASTCSCWTCSGGCSSPPGSCVAASD